VEGFRRLLAAEREPFETNVSTGMPGNEFLATQARVPRWEDRYGDEGIEDTGSLFDDHSGRHQAHPADDLRRRYLAERREARTDLLISKDLTD
jgi:hypothetical protein